MTPDPLTGLPDRQVIAGLVRQELRRRRTSPSALAVLLVDVDNFREINRRHLLAGGDEVLRQLAVARVAESIYEEKAFEQMPILADALEEAGCTDQEILGHCRGPGPH